MRDIRFRGLRTDGTWIFGSLVIADSFLKQMPGCHTKTWIVSSAFGNGGWFNIRTRAYVRPQTVGQFTGMRDGEYNEIYHDDIITDHVGIGVVVWDEENASFKVSYRKENLGLGKWFRDFIGNELKSILVIGNIHENEDLLK